MKSFNCKFPHSRQHSGQQMKYSDNPNLINKSQIDNSQTTEFLNHHRQSSSPLTQVAYKLSSMQVGSVAHSKKNSIASTAYQTPTTTKAKRPEIQNYYNKPCYNLESKATNHKINNYLKENSQNIFMQFQTVQPSKEKSVKVDEN